MGKKDKKENIEPEVIEEQKVEATEDKKSEVIEEPRKMGYTYVDELTIHELYDYIRASEILLRHYENQVMANQNVSELAYAESREIYDKYRKIRNVIFNEIEKRVATIHE